LPPHIHILYMSTIKLLDKNGSLKAEIDCSEYIGVSLGIDNYVRAWNRVDNPMSYAQLLQRIRQHTVDMLQAPKQVKTEEDAIGTEEYVKVDIDSTRNNNPYSNGSGVYKTVVVAYIQTNGELCILDSQDVVDRNVIFDLLIESAINSLYINILPILADELKSVNGQELYNDIVNCNPFVNKNLSALRGLYNLAVLNRGNRNDY